MSTTNSLVDAIYTKALASPVDVTDQDLDYVERHAPTAAAHLLRVHCVSARSNQVRLPLESGHNTVANNASVAKMWTDALAQNPNAPVSIALMNEVLSILTNFAGDMNNKNIIRNQRLDATEARLTALEDRPTLKYVGTWKLGEEYGPGDFVTYDGCVWAALARVKTSPSEDHTHWRMAVKRGRDAKGAR